MDRIQPFLEIALSGVATSIAVQVLKSPYIPIRFQDYPKITTALVSIGVAIYLAFQNGITPTTDWVEILGIASSILIISVVTYNNIIKKKDVIYRGQ